MPVSELFQVARGGFTRLAGTAPSGTSAFVAALSRELSELRRRLGLLHAEVSPDVLTLADDQAAYIEFVEGGSRGLASFMGNASGAGAGLIRFRVGGSGFASALATAGPTVTVGTGTLAGTTGTDTHLTIRADTATNRLYVENRTGSSRTYGFSFISMIGTVTGTWRTV